MEGLLIIGCDAAADIERDAKVHDPKGVVGLRSPGVPEVGGWIIDAHAAAVAIRVTQLIHRIRHAGIGGALEPQISHGRIGRDAHAVEIRIGRLVHRSQMPAIGRTQEIIRDLRILRAGRRVNQPQVKKRIRAGSRFRLVSRQRFPKIFGADVVVEFIVRPSIRQIIRIERIVVAVPRVSPL